MQTAIPCLFMRGGTSRGPFFLEADLPSDVESRDRVLLAALGSPDRRQIDGLGGASPLTSKVGIVRRSAETGIDLDCLFARMTLGSEDWFAWVIHFIPPASRTGCGSSV
jgi:4-oxalomesaconate tautomerase